MSHHISGIVASCPAFARTPGILKLGEPALLRCDMGFLPIDSQNAADLLGRYPGNLIPGFELLTAAVLAMLAKLSDDSELAYVETEYFGGTGGQGAAVFCDGKVSMQPTWSNEWQERPINRALASLGVTVTLPNLDEFDEIGLGDFRSNEDWRRAAASG